MQGKIFPVGAGLCVCPRLKKFFLQQNQKRGTERNGTERNGTERNGTERNGTLFLIVSLFYLFCQGKFLLKFFKFCPILLVLVINISILYLWVICQGIFGFLFGTILMLGVMGGLDYLV